MYFFHKKDIFYSPISSTDTQVLDNTNSLLTKTLLLGNGSQNLNNTLTIITTKIAYVLSTKNIDKQLL